MLLSILLFNSVYNCTKISQLHESTVYRKLKTSFTRIAMGLISTGALYVINEPLKKIGGGGGSLKLLEFSCC